jgi:CRISPR/Cas system CSM-associated protein Csm4 (group 5 of RAMP superfamily)
MHEKYLPFVAHQYRSDDLYEKPSEEVLKSEKEDQDQRRKYKKMRFKAASV